MRNSLASGSVQGAQRNNGPVLTPQAVLAIQGTSETGQGSRRPASPDAQVSGTGSEGAGETQAPAAAPGGGASAQNTAGPLDAQSGTKDKEDPDGDGLNEAEEKQVQELAKRDREVRAHEQAHARVGGPYAGAPSYTFQQGPDGKRYAIGGEVQIDTSKEKTPQETIRKMQIVIRAALAPAEPSSQDLKVAQLARSQLSEAQAEAREEKANELQGDDEGEASSLNLAEGSGQTDAQDGGDGASADTSGRSGGESSGFGERGAEAASAYQSALQRVNDAQALLASLVA